MEDALEFAKELIPNDAMKPILGKQYGYYHSALRAILNHIKNNPDDKNKFKYGIDQIDDGCFEIV